ncbi:gem-associated protein 2 [Pogonomyrmex barbatus]|uniref:Gem-associated protein 2 n=1 Tax=Pogonomyrmex barbatus TaxID=144034 RepID=A0A6I9XH36_9HYME|nr:gem-associated protein 2 [Pogonomyrmex barbatus]
MECLKQPVFVVGDIDENINLSVPPSSGEEYLAGCIQAPVNLKPTIEWQQYQVSDFSKIRLYVNQLKDEIQMGRHKWKPPEIELPDIDDQNAWINFCLGEKKIEPTLNTLFCFNQSSVEQVLEYLVQFVETERRIQYKIGRWIYTLLASLEQPLQPDTCHCLRSLARTCSIIRADSRELDAQELGALNLFICLVARYFRQLDLADP